MTIISACLIVSRPWLLQLWPTTLISRVRERSLSYRRSSKRNSSKESGGRMGVFRSFSHLTEKPPAVDASMGAPFKFDVEKNATFDTVSHDFRLQPCRPNLFCRIYLRTRNGSSQFEVPLKDFQLHTQAILKSGSPGYHHYKHRIQGLASKPGTEVSNGRRSLW